uniref:Uncharacterized protein n=1 Tax=Panagrolaimus sp. JU765 TaxID=591449 RepID=A0AC34QMV7_9BILA
MSLYQIIDVNEPSQNIKMNVWMIQKWVDEALDWDPAEYNGINTTILPHDVLWLPDTVVYNSISMNQEDSERYMNIRVDSLRPEGKRGALMSFLYPAIYTVTCRLNIRYFPYDQQNCTLTISSWTNSKSALDYYADEYVNLQSYISNEEWDVISFKIYRHEYKYACCPEPIVLRRKALYYLVNLIIPTSVITIVAVTGFFTPASTSDDRTEKINLGITTLLAMSILMLMVSDQMPTTSEFVPLIAWFYLIEKEKKKQKNPTKISAPLPEPNNNTLAPPPTTPISKGPEPEKHDNPGLDKAPLERLPSNSSMLKPGRAKSNWLKVGAAASRRSIESRNSFALTEMGLTPESPSPSALASRRSSAWDNTMAIVTSPTTSNKDNPKTPRLKEVDSMKQRRQCSLEWELLATILDRILLVIFVSSVLIITAGMMGTGYVAQRHYDQLARERL